MTKNNITELVFILDCSGSMAGLEADTIGGFNSLIEKQKKQDGECYVSTILFDNISEVVHDRVKLVDIKPMTDSDYIVRGCTALLDAIGGAIHHIACIHKYARPEDVPKHTMFVITTDSKPLCSPLSRQPQSMAIITSAIPSRCIICAYLIAEVIKAERDRTMRYIAFDVETPNRYNNRMSAIGITVLEEDRIADSFYSLVDPEQPFDWFNTQLTGISAESVRGAPTFAALWPVIEPIMSSGLLVAHNASFDMGVLRRCLGDYGIAWRPSVQGLCTVLMGRSLLPGQSHKLNELCRYYGIELDHHHADSDSRACAEILLRYIEDGAEPEKHIRSYSMTESRSVTKRTRKP